MLDGLGNAAMIDAELNSGARTPARVGDTLLRAGLADGVYRSKTHRFWAVPESLGLGADRRNLRSSFHTDILTIFAILTSVATTTVHFYIRVVFISIVALIIII